MSVTIETVCVPQFQTITCKCEISSSGSNEQFVFEYSGNTDVEHTWFRLNELVLNKTSFTYRTVINNEADLIFFTTNDSASTEARLNVFTGLNLPLIDRNITISKHFQQK